MRPLAGVSARAVALVGAAFAVAAPAVAAAFPGGAPWALVAVVPLSLVLVTYLPVRVAGPLVALLAVAAAAGAVPLAGAPAAVAVLLAAGSVGALGLRCRGEVDGLTRALRATERRVVAVGVQDELTACANHQGLLLLGEQVLHAVRRGSDSVHAVLVEVGGLDAVRRWSGPPARDVVLVAVAEALTAGTRATDVVARWGPETFAVVGPGSGSGPAEIERRVRVRLLDDPPVPPGLWPCHVTAGAGVLEPWDDGTLVELLERAEQDLSLRRALRSPSAPEPPRHERR